MAAWFCRRFERRQSRMKLMLTLSKLQEKAKWNTSTVSTGHDMNSTAAGKDKWILFESAAIIWQWDCRANAPLYTSLAWAAKWLQSTITGGRVSYAIEAPARNKWWCETKKTRTIIIPESLEHYKFPIFCVTWIALLLLRSPSPSASAGQPSQADSSHLFPQLMDHASFLAVDQYKFQVPSLVQVSYPSIHLGRKWRDLLDISVG
jgi:hypothetical protein